MREREKKENEDGDDDEVECNRLASLSESNLALIYSAALRAHANKRPSDGTAVQSIQTHIYIYYIYLRYLLS